MVEPVPIPVRDGVTRSTRAGDDYVYLSDGDTSLAVDHLVAHVIDGSVAVSQPFRAGVELVLSRCGFTTGDHYRERARREVVNTGPIVSIIIPNKNGGELLRRTLASVEAQTYDNYQIIVVDGASTDDSSTIASKYDATWVVVPEGSGFARACNAGAAASDGAFLLILNNDTELESDFLGQIVDVALREGSDVAAIAPMVRRGDLRFVTESLGNVLGSRGFGAGRFAGLIDVGQFEHSEELFGAPFTAALLRRSIWDEIGPMDERFDFYYEDVEWCTRARLVGYRVMSAPQAIVYHEGSASLGSDLSPRKLEMVTRNRLLWAMSSLRAKTVVRYGGSYVREDTIRLLRSVQTHDLAEATAVLRAWGGVTTSLWATRNRRKSTLERHDLSMRSLLELAIAPPPFYAQDGALLLTESMVRSWFVAAANH
jgi:GT2 family glycosyltransferase